MFMLFVLMAVFAPLSAPYSPLGTIFTPMQQSTWKHWVQPSTLRKTSWVK